MAAPFSIRNFVKKQMMKTNDEGIMVIPNSQKVDFQSAILKELLIKNGIDPSAIKTETAMNEAMAFINQRTKQETGIMAASQGNVIDIRDKMPNPFENLDKAVKEGNFMGIKSQVLKDPDIKKDFEAMKKFPTRTAEGEGRSVDEIGENQDSLRPCQSGCAAGTSYQQAQEGQEPHPIPSAAPLALSLPGRRLRGPRCTRTLRRGMSPAPPRHRGDQGPFGGHPAQRRPR